jgi:predicted DNA-binding transcriptional regulator AlpA
MPVDLITVADIGRMFGVSRQAASRWTHRLEFPAPHGQTGSGRVWKRADVEKWARKAGRLE